MKKLKICILLIFNLIPMLSFGQGFDYNRPCKLHFTGLYFKNWKWKIEYTFHDISDTKKAIVSINQYDSDFDYYLDYIPKQIDICVYKKDNKQGTKTYKIINQNLVDKEDFIWIKSEKIVIVNPNSIETQVFGRDKNGSIFGQDKCNSSCYISILDFWYDTPLFNNSDSYLCPYSEVRFKWDQIPELQIFIDTMKKPLLQVQQVTDRLAHFYLLCF